MNESISTQTPIQKNAAKFAFFYMLSLVALITMAVSVGTIIFQIINKKIGDPVGIFGGSFTSEGMRFAISSLIISAPIFYLMMWQILKNLFSGSLNKDSGIRRWLTYFIQFISAVVMLGWLIGTLNNFLNGELTNKFILKALTSILISGIIFSYYFYDMKRSEVAGKKDKIISYYFYGSLVVVIAALIAGFFFIDSPQKVRDQKRDQQIMNQLDQIDSAVNDYFNLQKSVPKNLEDMLKDKTRTNFLTQDMLKDPNTDKNFEYKKTAADTYEICTSFTLSNKDLTDNSQNYDKVLYDRWSHQSGKQCFSRKAVLYQTSKDGTLAVPQENVIK